MLRQITLNGGSRLPSCGSHNGSLPPSTPKDGQTFFELNGMNPIPTNSFVNSAAFLTLGNNKQNLGYNRFINCQNGIQQNTSSTAFNFNIPYQSAAFYNAARLNSRSLDESIDNKQTLTPTTVISNIGPDLSMQFGSKNNSSSSADYRKYSHNSQDSTIGHYNNCNNINHVRESSINSNRYSVDQRNQQDIDNSDSVFLPNNASYSFQRAQFDSDDYLTPLAASSTSTMNHRPVSYVTNGKFL
jgi:hypothetical protein